MALGLKPIEIVNKNEYQLLVKASHWERVFLADVASVQNGFAFKSGFFGHDSGLPLIRIRDIDRETTENLYTGEFEPDYLVDRGDYLIGMDGDFKAAIWKGEQALLNQRVCRLKPLTDQYAERFLFVCLQPYLNAINAETSSVTVKHLSSRTIEEIPLPLPPLNEQHRIVAKIEELFSELEKGVESLKTAREQLKVYRQSVLKAAFEGRLTESWRKEHADELESADELLTRIKAEREARYAAQLAEWQQSGGLINGKKAPKPKKPKELPPLTADELADLPDLPEGWEWTRLEAISFILSGFAFKSGDFISSGIPVIKIGNVGYSEFYWKDQQYLGKNTIEEFEGFAIYPDDILIALTRPITNNRMKVCSYPRNAPMALLNQRVASIKDICIDNNFLFLYFNTASFKESIRSKFSETLQPNLSPKDLAAIAIPIPSLIEQKQIVQEIESRFSVVEKMEQTIEESLQKAEALRQSILKRAFEGKLVPQNPDDEPASELLARIRAERESMAPVKRGRKVRDGV